ncbi:transposable element Tcb1 transposase [Trichonephila clavipes]|nr:transposable element Tcb1 transposase [Trichonephila clavipes]
MRVISLPPSRSPSERQSLEKIPSLNVFFRITLDQARIFSLFFHFGIEDNYHTHLEEEYTNHRKPPDGVDRRHNDESVREGYKRNGDKEVKLFTSALKACQCNDRIVMAQRKHLDDFLRGRIIGRLECGRTQLEVSEKLGIAQSAISRLWQRFHDDCNVSRCYSSGIFGSYCQKKQTEHSIRPVSSATGTTVSRQTVYRRLGHIGLYARRPVRYVPLTATHCRLRLTWSREHALWTPQQWSCVVFSDDTYKQEEVPIKL